MITKNISIGKLLVTDAAFGPVAVSDVAFVRRLVDLGVAVDKVAWMQQVHGTHVEVAFGPGVYADTDVLVTRTPGLMIVTRTADCVPLLLWDPVTRTVAAVHSGREGFLKGVVQSGLDALADLGCKAADLRCFLGPHLRAEHHEVSSEIAGRVVADLVDVALMGKEGKIFFDLTAGVVEVLKRTGVSDLNIVDCGSDTFSDADFFSYRKMTGANDPSAKTNRFASGILLAA